jgi:hypothetical protein
VRGRKPLRVAGDVEDPAFDLHWRARRAAGFRGPQAAAEPEPQQAAVAGFGPRPLDRAPGAGPPRGRSGVCARPSFRLLLPLLEWL